MKAGKTLKVGRSDFKLIVKDNYYFVDKTMLVKDFLENTSDVLVMPRPKRFGKTLNLSMIEYFFDIEKPADKVLFDEFEIAEEKEFCQAHQNKYPVINLTLKQVKGENWEECFQGFKIVISELYKKHKFLLNSDKLDEQEKEIFQNILDQSAGERKYAQSLAALSKHLVAYYEKEVIILVDEYDTPIISAYRNTPKPIKSPKGDPFTFYQKTVGFMQTFLGEAFKGNLGLKKGLITGVMRIAKESIFSDWNNFYVHGITSPYFSDKFGFTEEEVLSMLKYFDFEDDFDEVKAWYNGYKFGKIDKIYNPWSIVNYVGSQEAGFIPYWVNTSDDSLIKECMTEPNIKADIETLLEGKTLTKTIRENFVFSDFEDDRELLWTLLFQGGFLTQVKSVSLYRYELRIPNYELSFVFKDLILNWIKSAHKINQDTLINTANALINNDLEAFEEGFKHIISDTISYFDFGGEPEKIFHVYTLGLLAVLTDDYIIKSNRESGAGRYDILLLPKDRKNNGIIIEIKRIKGEKKKEGYTKFHKRINKEIANALEQIQRKRYYKVLLKHDIDIEKILRVPLIFAGQEPYVLPVVIY